MAGGPFAEIVTCAVCGRRAERTYEGAETDQYVCTLKHEFGIHFNRGPALEACWPPRGENRKMLALLAAHKSWDLAAIDEEIARLAPPVAASPPDAPAARGWFDELARATSATWARAKRSFASAYVPAVEARHAPPLVDAQEPAPPPAHVVAAWLRAEHPEDVRRTHEWLVATVRKMEDSWTYAKENFAGDDWDDFSSYKGNERWCSDVVGKMGSLDLERLPCVDRLLDAVETIVAETSGPVDYARPDAGRRSVIARIEAIRARGADALSR